MAKNITYLLGAGASAHCLPVITDMVHRMRKMISTFERAKLRPNENFTGIKTELHQATVELVNDVKWLIDEARKHQTIDTLAKKYYLISSKHDDLKKLKKILTIYFLYEQFYPDEFIRDKEIKELPDKRYDSFIASIIDSKIGSYKLPDNLKIITWNYDLQFELSYREYQSDKNIAQIQKQLQILPSKSILDSKYDIKLSKFALIHLNGVAGIGKVNKWSNDEESSFLDQVSISNPLNSLIEYYSSFDTELPDDPITHPETMFFNYSWEVNKEFENNIYPNAVKIRNTAIEIMKHTEILVVIGYSFPFFNKVVDQELFAGAKKLRKVYVQDLKATDIENQLRSSFEILKKYNAMGDVEIETRTGVNQFLIPYEFEV